MPKKPEVSLAVLRIVLGIVFLVYGVENIFISSLSDFTEKFKALGVPMPLLTAPLVAVFDTAAGILLILGIGVRPIATALAFIMLGAVFFSGIARGFFVYERAELPMLLLAMAAAIAIGGAGAGAYDGMPRRRKSTPKKTKLKKYSNAAH